MTEPGSDRHDVRERGGDIWWCNISGGTDFAGAFIGGNRELPQVPGEMQCRLLGCAVEAWNEQGEPVIGEVVELVCSHPIPSMPWQSASKRQVGRLSLSRSKVERRLPSN
jgi:acetoacetyl-CoA synthetase